MKGERVEKRSKLKQKRWKLKKSMTGKKKEKSMEHPERIELTSNWSVKLTS